MEPSSRENDFKDDLKPRSQRGFDPRDSKVRRQSIGWLDDSYFSGRIVLRPRYFSDTYTRIPPLSTLPNLWNSRGLKQNLLKNTGELFAVAGASLAGAYAWTQSKTVHVKEAMWTRMPKSYSLTRGAFIEWATLRRKALRILVPFILLALLVLALVFFVGQTHEQVQPRTHTQNSGSSYMPHRKPGPTSGSKSGNSSTSSSASTNSQATPAINANTASPTSPSSSVSTSGSETSSSSPSSSPSSSTLSSSSAPATSSTSSSSSTSSGGTGGGSSSSSSLLPTTVTVPGVNTSLDTKPLVVTSPVTLTLN